MNNSIKNTLHFIGLLAAQVLIVDQIDFLGLNAYINPILIGAYLFFIPLNWKTNQLLFVAFFIGIILDAFHNTLGMNASAMLTIAFFRPAFLRIILPREGLASDSSPTVFTLKTTKFLIFSGILFFVYHLVYFSLESLIIESFITILIKAVLSSIFAILLALLYQYLTLKKH